MKKTTTQQPKCSCWTSFQIFGMPLGFLLGLGFWYCSLHPGMDWSGLSLLTLGVCVLPCVCILLSPTRTFLVPAPPLLSFCVWLIPLGVQQHTLDFSLASIAGAAFGLLTLTLVCWLPFSRTLLCGDRNNVLCGPRTLYLICRHYGIRISPYQLQRLAKRLKKGNSLPQLVTAATAAELQVQRIPGTRISLRKLKSLALAVVKTRNGFHAIAIFWVRGDKVLIHDPNRPWRTIVSINELNERLQGDILALSHGYDEAPKNEEENGSSGPEVSKAAPRYATITYTTVRGTEMVRLGKERGKSMRLFTFLKPPEQDSE